MDTINFIDFCLGIATESSFKSSLSSEYSKSDTVNINKFTRVDLNTLVQREETRSKGTKNDGVIKEIKYRITDNHFKSDTDGCAFYDGDNNVAILVTLKMPNNFSYIDFIEVTDKYRGKGLSRQLIDIAMKQYHATVLCVDYDNEIARSLYKKCGFVENFYDNHIHMVHSSSLKQVSLSSLKETKLTDPSQLPRKFRMRHGDIKISGKVYAYTNGENVIAILAIHNGTIHVQVYDETVDHKILKDLMQKGIAFGASSIKINKHDKISKEYAKQLGLEVL